MVPSSTSALLWRGLRKQCGVCEQGKLFERWFTMIDDCPRCGLHFERVEGHWIGAIGINTIVSLGLMMIAMVAGFVVTYPDPPVTALVTITVTIALVTPIAFYPTSKTLWTAIDLRMRPVQPDEVLPGFWA